MHTNEDHEDPDMPATYPLVRSFSRQEKLWFHKLQTFYWPLLLPFSVSRYPLQNLLIYGGPVGYFLVWILIMWVIPAGTHGATGLAYSVIIQGLTGVLITYKFAVSHAHVDLVPHSEGNPDELKTNPSMRVDAWLTNQLEESCDWGGYWSTLFWGGINLQIEHHIAPALEPPLLWYLAQELKPICREHGIRYTEEPTFLRAVLKFHERLWLMGQKSCCREL